MRTYIERADKKCVHTYCNCETPSNFGYLDRALNGEADWMELR
jgi:hypothetical protein